MFASGGLGTIRRAFDRRLQREVAVKEIREFSRGSVSERRFLREARITARLEHPAIVPVHDIGQHENGEPYYCMKLVDGTSLHALVQASPGLVDRIALLPHVVAVAEALAYAHDRGVIHRDLKPTNILVGPFGETVVIDWGLAKELHADEDRNTPATSAELGDTADGDLTRTGEFVGTLAFMPPEQALGAESDRRADVYALGAILYFVLSTSVPYEQADARDRLTALLAGPPTDLATLEPGTPADLLAIVRKAMTRAPHQRYASAQELATDLRRFQEGRLVAARNYSTRELLGHFVRRHRARLLFGAASLGLLAILQAYSYVQIVDQKRVADEQRAQAVAAQEAERAVRTLAETRARETRQIAVQQLVETGRRDLFERREPQRALVSLVAAYRLDDSRDDLRRMLHEATARAGNLQIVLHDVVGFRYSGSGNSLLTWHQDDSVAVWGIQTNTEAYRIPLPAEVLWSAFAPGSDDRIIVGTSQGVRLYDHGALVWELGEETVTYLPALLPDAGDTMVIPSGGEGSVSVELDTGALHRLPPMGGAQVLGSDKSAWHGASILLSSTVLELEGLSESSPTRVERYDRSGRRSAASSIFYRNTAHSLVFSPDGRTISYVRGFERTAAMLDDVVTGRSRILAACGEIDIERDERPDPTAAFSPDGESLYRLVGRRQLAKWNTETLACESVRTDFDLEYDRLAITPDGEHIVLVSKRGIVSVLTAATLSEHERFNADTRPIKTFAVHPRATHFALLNLDGDLRQWRLGEPRMLAQRTILDVAPGIRPNELVVLTGEPGGSNRLKTLRVSSGDAALVEMAFSEPTAHDSLLFVQGYPGTVATMNPRKTEYELWAVETGRKLGSEQPKHRDVPLSAWNDILTTTVSAEHRTGLRLPRIDHLTAMPSPRGLAAGSGPHLSNNLYDITSGVLIAPLHGNYSRFSPDGRLVFTSSGNDDLYVHDSATGAELLRHLSGTDPGHVITQGDPAVTFSPDGELFAFSHNDGTITLWDSRTMVQVGALHGHLDWARRLAFSPTSENLLSLADVANSDGQIFLWELDTFTGQRLDFSHPISFAFHPGGDTVALGDKDGVVKLWDTGTGGQVAELRGHFGPVRQLAFADGDRLITAARADRVVVWQLGKESRPYVALEQFTREVIPPDLLGGMHERSSHRP